MLYKYFFVFIFGITAAIQAPVNYDSAKKAIAIADFPRGNIVFYTKRKDQVKVHVDITGLPEEGGPFQYHIHTNGVPANADPWKGQCDGAGGHFNPYDAAPNCDQQQDDSFCEIGDLSGKHGWIDTTCFELKYYDPYLSLNPANPAFVVGKSVVFHYANLTAFACATIEWVNEERQASLIKGLSERGDTELSNISLDLVDEQEFDEVTNSLLAPSTVGTSTALLLPTTVSENDFSSETTYPTGTPNNSTGYNETNWDNRNISAATAYSTDCENLANGLHWPLSFVVSFFSLIAGIII